MKTKNLLILGTLFTFTALFTLTSLAEPTHDGGAQPGAATQPGATGTSQRQITDPKEAHAIMVESEKENSEWLPISCSLEGCVFQKMLKGKPGEEVFVSAKVKKLAEKLATENHNHVSEYPELKNIADFETQLAKETKAGKKYMIVKFGAPNHNCISCLRFDKVMSEPESKKLLADKKTAVYAIDVAEFKNPEHGKLAGHLGAAVASDSFHIPFVTLLELDGNGGYTKRTILNGYFGGADRERAKLFKWLK